MADVVYRPPIPLNTTWSRSIVTLNSVLPCICLFFVFLRFYARKLKRLSIEIDDWLILLALFVHILHSVTGIWGCAAAGLGHHVANVSPDVLTNNGKLLIVTQLPFAIGLGLTKSSACLLLRRVFHVNRTFNIIVWILLGLAVSWSVMNIFTIFFDCRPLARNWNKEIPNGKCDNVAGVFLGVAIIDIVVDLGILILPVPIMWRLQMPRHLKLGAILAFGLGYLTVGIAASRIATDLEIDLEGDFTWTESPLFFWSYLEVGIAIIVACSIVLKPVIERFITPLLRNKSTTHTRGSYANIESDTFPLKPFLGSQANAAAGDVDKSPTSARSALPGREDQIRVKREVTVEEESA